MGFFTFIYCFLYHLLSMPLLPFLHLNHKYAEASILLQAGISRQAFIHVLIEVEHWEFHMLALSAFMHYGGGMMN